MTALPAVRTVADVIQEEIRPQIAEALPPNVSLDRFMRTALTAIQLNPEIQQHDQKSLYLSLVRCASDGLLPDGREAALVLFNDKKSGTKKVQYLPMVLGLRKRAAEFGISIVANAVYEHDTFEYELGFEPTVTHKPPPFGRERGQLVGAYAMATDRHGRRYLEPMDRAQIEVVKSVSRAKDGDLWTKWEPEAFRKTVARRLVKQLPLFDESVRSLLAAWDEEFELRSPEQQVADAIGVVGPPDDDAAPDDSPPAGGPRAGDEVIDGEAVEEPAGSGEGTAPGPAVLPPIDGAGEQRTFQQMAADAQRRKAGQENAG